MKRRINRLALLLLLFVSIQHLSAAQQPSAMEKASPEVVWSDDDTDKNELEDKLIIGMVETVYVEPGHLRMDARIDTGANTTSMDAQGLQIVNEDGQDWAQFTVNGAPVRSKVVKYVLIKQHGAKSQRRPVIVLKVTLGSVTQTVKATLTDRSNFKYKMLIGVNFLRDHFIVDVSRKNVFEPVVSP